MIRRLPPLMLAAFAGVYLWQAFAIPLDPWSASEAINARTLPFVYAGVLMMIALALVIRLRRRVLIPFVIVFSLLGVYLTSLNAFDVQLMLGFALAGLALRLTGFTLAPLLLGFILSGMLEENLRRTMLLADGSLGLFLDRPVSLALAGLCVLVWLVPLKRLLAKSGKTGRSAA